jgi:hypothetical protein
MSTGRHYWEMKLKTRAPKGRSAIAFGVVPATTSNYDKGHSGSGAYYIDASRGSLQSSSHGLQDADPHGSFSDGDCIGVLLDCDEGWMRFYLNGKQHGPGFTEGMGQYPLVRAAEFYYPVDTVTVLPGASVPQSIAVTDEATDTTTGVLDARKKPAEELRSAKSSIRGLRGLRGLQTEINVRAQTVFLMERKFTCVIYKGNCLPAHPGIFDVGSGQEPEPIPVYVVPHGAKYKVQVANPFDDRRASVVLHIDGSWIGAWILAPSECFVIERPSTITKCFTFLQEAHAAEAEEKATEFSPAHTGIVQGQLSNGLVKCCFTPEILFLCVTIPEVGFKEFTVKMPDDGKAGTFRGTSIPVGGDLTYFVDQVFVSRGKWAASMAAFDQKPATAEFDLRECTSVAVSGTLCQAGRAEGSQGFCVPQKGRLLHRSAQGPDQSRLERALGLCPGAQSTLCKSLDLCPGATTLQGPSQQAFGSQVSGAECARFSETEDAIVIEFKLMGDSSESPDEKRAGADNASQATALRYASRFETAPCPEDAVDHQLFAALGEHRVETFEQVMSNMARDRSYQGDTSTLEHYKEQSIESHSDDPARFIRSYTQEWCPKPMYDEQCGQECSRQGCHNTSQCMCPVCKQAQYCSANCMMQDWERHKWPQAGLKTEDCNRSPYRVMNQRLLKKELTSSDFMVGYTKMFMLSLGRLDPIPTCTVFRALSNLPRELHDKFSGYKPDDEFVFNNVNSTSLDIAASESFLGTDTPSNLRVFLTIDCIQGFAIEQFSEFPCEKEVIVPAGSKFRVTRQSKNGSRLDLHLTQLPPQKAVSDALGIQSTSVHAFTNMPTEQHEEAQATFLYTSPEASAKQKKKNERQAITEKFRELERQRKQHLEAAAGQKKLEADARKRKQKLELEQQRKRERDARERKQKLELEQQRKRERDARERKLKQQLEQEQQRKHECELRDQEEADRKRKQKLELDGKLGRQWGVGSLFGRILVVYGWIGELQNWVSLALVSLLFTIQPGIFLSALYFTAVIAVLAMVAEWGLAGGCSALMVWGEQKPMGDRWLLDADANNSFIQGYRWYVLGLALASAILETGSHSHSGVIYVVLAIGYCRADVWADTNWGLLPLYLPVFAVFHWKVQPLLEYLFLDTWVSAYIGNMSIYIAWPFQALLVVLLVAEVWSCYWWQKYGHFSALLVVPWCYGAWPFN